MNLRILETVESQVDRVAALLEGERGGVGLRFLEEYRSVLKVLPDNPRFYPRVEDPMAGHEVRHALVLRASYRVIFEIRSEEVVVLSVLHSHQRPGACTLRSRMSESFAPGTAPMLPFRFVLALPILASALLLAAEPSAPAPANLFNEKDLAGWRNSNCAEGTFFVKDKELITTGKPIGFLHTAKQYENFELEVEWMHVNKKEVGNSGIFVWCDSLPAVGTPFTRGIEVQVLVNYPDVGWATNHGDIFSIWGAKCKPDRPHPKGYERCLPSENRAKGGGEWNHYKIVANDGTIKLSVNGKEVSGVSECKPRRGYIAIESEGAECHYRNFKFKELPSTNPKPEECATEAKGHVSLFDHVSLGDWKCKAGAWVVQGETLTCKGGDDLSRKVESKKCEVLFDWKLPAKSAAKCEVRLGDQARFAEQVKGVKLGEWNRAAFEFDPQGPGRALKFVPAEGLQLRNLYLREMK